MGRVLTEDDLELLEECAFYESGLSSHGCLENLDPYTMKAIKKYGRYLLSQITNMKKTKYKFIETTGCTAFDFSVNDKSVSELSNDEIDKILNYLFVKVKEGISEQTILFEDVVKLFQPDDWEHDPEPCGQCGDTVSTTTWNI